MERLNDKLDAGVQEGSEADAGRRRRRPGRRPVDEQFKPEELKRLKAGVSNGGYHYLGAAKILAPIGKAFADALRLDRTKAGPRRPRRAGP